MMRKSMKYLLLLVLCSCNHTSAKNEKDLLSVSNLVQELKPIHQFKDDKTKEVVGEVYVNYTNDTLFSSLYILQEQDTVYRVSQDGFFTLNKKELSINKDKFFGYKLISKGDDYISIALYRDSIRDVTDPVDIWWCKEEKVFGILRF
ncbi:MAG: hypothetical protein COW03_11635 [Cytophagales bacterium CG12_big_fil_rev_8_21_14_0_65_40_12]|nr:MAG: hypothetical protein COW03_11635 [Cytophagales bacterium CG12_big_fil_rev_8_21_14_0_65_40_12]